MAQWDDSGQIFDQDQDEHQSAYNCMHGNDCNCLARSVLIFNLTETVMMHSAKVLRYDDDAVTPDGHASVLTRGCVHLLTIQQQLYFNKMSNAAFACFAAAALNLFNQSRPTNRPSASLERLGRQLSAALGILDRASPPQPATAHRQSP